MAEIDRHPKQFCVSLLAIFMFFKAFLLMDVFKKNTAGMMFSIQLPDDWYLEAGLSEIKANTILHRMTDRLSNLRGFPSTEEPISFQLDAFSKKDKEYIAVFEASYDEIIMLRIPRKQAQKKQPLWLAHTLLGRPHVSICTYDLHSVFNDNSRNPANKSYR